MIKTGLVSVTFRNLLPSEIVELVRQAGLKAIEWGGDVHVPHGDLGQAQKVLAMTQAAGLEVSSYGSYYRLGCIKDNPSFEDVLATAMALHAPTIRVWAGDRGSDAADEARRRKVQEDGKRISALAAKEALAVAFEYHEDTLTDTPASARKLLMDIDHSNVRCYWQPPMHLTTAERMHGLQDILPWLSNLHVFNQAGESPAPLDEGIPEWLRYMQIVRTLPGDRYALLEFVHDNSAAQFLQDARALKTICAEAGGDKP